MRKNKLLKISLIIIGSLLLMSIIISIIINIRNQNILDKVDRKLVIYQYETENFNIKKDSTPIIYEVIDFNESTIYEKTIYSLDDNYYNTLVINNGVAYIKEANCTYHYCENSKISLGRRLINNISITCMCSGLYIVVE